MHTMVQTCSTIFCCGESWSETTICLVLLCALVNTGPGVTILCLAGHSDKFVQYKTFLHALDLLLPDEQVSPALLWRPAMSCQCCTLASIKQPHGIPATRLCVPVCSPHTGASIQQPGILRLMILLTLL